VRGATKVGTYVDAHALVLDLHLQLHTSKSIAFYSIRTFDIIRERSTPSYWRSIVKRSECDAYSSCTNRTAILVVIVAISFLTTSILLFYCLRKRTSVHPGPTRFRVGLVHPHKVQRMEARATWRREDRCQGDVGTELPRYEERSDAPPPYGYVVVRPEDVHVYDGRRSQERRA
jgi:hypothetical protein